MKQSHQPYSDLLNSVYHQRDMEMEEISELLEFVKCMPRGLNEFNTAFFVLDYSQRKYKVFTNPEQVSVGYHPLDLVEGGLEFVMDIYNKDDFALVNEKVFMQTLNILKNADRKDHLRYLFTYTYRVKNSAGQYSTLLQKSKYITDKETGILMYTFGSIMDITAFKPDDRMIYRVEKYEEKIGAQILTNVIDNVYYPYPENALLTLREKEILGWISEGISTKQIAGKLFVMDKTIANHKSNMLRKTNTKNVAELIKFAIKSGII